MQRRRFQFVENVPGTVFQLDHSRYPKDRKLNETHVRSDGVGGDSCNLEGTARVESRFAYCRSKGDDRCSRCLFLHLKSDEAAPTNSASDLRHINESNPLLR